MNNAEELINLICNAEYSYKGYNGEMETCSIVSQYSSSRNEERTAIAGAVYTWLGNQLTDMEKDKHMGELEAKVYTYEKIIANSNFAPMIVKESEDME